MDIQSGSTAARPDSGGGNPVSHAALRMPRNTMVRVADSRVARQAFGYLLVGGLAAIVDIGLFHWLTVRSTQVLLPAIFSFLVAAVVNYALSSVWVYRRQWRSWRRASMFLLFALIGLCINAGVTWWLAGNFAIFPTLAKVGGVGIAFVANFLMNTFIVFRGEDS